MRILVLGATGMLGHAVFRVFSADAGHDTWGTLRSAAGLRHFPAAAHARLLSGVDALDHSVADHMTRNVVTASEDDGVLEIAQTMSTGRFTASGARCPR